MTWNDSDRRISFEWGFGGSFLNGGTFILLMNVENATRYARVYQKYFDEFRWNESSLTEGISIVHSPTTADYEITTFHKTIFRKMMASAPTNNARFKDLTEELLHQ